MNKLLLLLAIFLDFVAPAQTILDAPGVAAFIPNASSGGPCITSVTGTTTANIQFSTSGANHMAFAFVPSCSSTVTTCTARLAMPSGNGLPSSFTLQAAVFSNASGVPGTQIGTASATVLESTIGTTEQDVVFTGMSASLTSGTTYWMCMLVGNTFSGTPCAWYCVPNTSAGGVAGFGIPVSSWSSSGVPNISGKFILQ